MALSLDAAARTHVGLVRRRNEDALYAGEWLFAVADGLGGHVAGDIASATVIDILRSLDHAARPDELPTLFGRAIHAANSALRERIEAEPELAGMGSTLVALLWSGTSAIVANIGDSRAYVLRTTSGEDLKLIQITEDHVYGNLVADASQVPNLPERLSRFLDGRADGRSPDITSRGLHDGDRLLLCSDGLTAVVPGGLIRDVLASFDDPREAADRLIDLANEQGGPDNVTVIVIDVRDRDADTSTN
ncbi:hypothetical protein Aph01nite_08240 [Acrocarpospora phusangensis]|uniref:PPM-type phosphatase domain-containing protein n=1 Tax=Acrocarpospora phusangensis TaxID=1070424 RepID=A0A919Q525_9ACTN|nr:protein phosphatase 2C domain-containing protein [Acrocarpospora phusangensis]GIH22514.1 hypothetical protein Aph01nite_08240 [Acrocarpospora phusangensis]